MKLHLSLYIAACSLFALACRPQADSRNQIERLLEKSRDFYKSRTSLKYEVNYELFPTYESKSVTESYDGAIFKKDQNYYARIAKTEFVLLKELFIKIDNATKRMEVSSSRKTDFKTPDNILSLLANFNTFRIESNDQFWICTMTGPEIMVVPYGRVVICLNKNDYSIAKESLFLLKQNQYKNRKGRVLNAFPRLDISFMRYETDHISFGTKFEKSEYLASSSGKISPSKKYTGYQIVN